jgi:hypothetical protein
VGSENGSFYSKILAVRPNLHNVMHASLLPEENKQKDIDQVQFCLKYCGTTMYFRHAKEMKRQMNLMFSLIRAHVIVSRDVVRECSTIISIQ